MNLEIEFEGACNQDNCQINYARFRTKNGHLIGVDRDQTHWYFEKGFFDMLWSNCYIWEIDSEYPFADEEESRKKYPDEELYKVLKESKFDSFVFDDEADEQYKAEVEGFYLHTREVALSM